MNLMDIGLTLVVIGALLVVVHVLWHLVVGILL
jgi:hypothetical protein